MREYSARNGEVTYPDGSQMGALSASKLINHLERENKKQDKEIKELKRKLDLAVEALRGLVKDIETPWHEEVEWSALNRAKIALKEIGETK